MAEGGHSTPHTQAEMLVTMDRKAGEGGHWSYSYGKWSGDDRAGLMGKQDISTVCIGRRSNQRINPLSTRWYARYHEEVSERHLWDMGSILRGD